MNPAAHPLLVFVVFLSRLEEAALSQNGHCTGNRCFALFQDSADFPGAQNRCKDSGGLLLKFNRADLETLFSSVSSGLGGSYWLKHAEDPPALQNCSSISVSTGRNVTLTWVPCVKNLDGFLCQYLFTEPCGELNADKGAQVTYVAPMGFGVRESQAFPPGTIAFMEQVGAKHPDSKSVCVFERWLQAPWNCEVMNGGCERGCNATTSTCTCPTGQTLHPNKLTCATDLPQGQQEGDTPKCYEGYRLALDQKTCVDVNECEEEDPCVGVGEECKNTQGSYKCRCRDEFEEEDGACVDISICQKCEHLLCNKFNGVYRCECRQGYRVSPQDLTKCERYCDEKECPATCIMNVDNKKQDMLQCYCPDGFILDIRDNSTICTDINECENGEQCGHTCENLFGGYRCSCNEGYRLEEGYKCFPIEAGKDGEEEGSGSPPLHPTTASPQPVGVPPYVKAGSLMGITVFLLLSAALLFFLLHNMIKRCGRFNLTPLKHPNIDMFYLQQVATETYKRLSFDKESRNDSQTI